MDDGTHLTKNDAGLYHPIEPSQGFRILLLQPAPELSADIKCNLIYVEFKDHPDYEALSYVWGDRSERGSVTLDGRDVHVTPNLESALRYLRKTDSPRYLWVDALSIDQRNLDERSEHVQHMDEIYRCCTTDLLWFGPDASLMDDAVEALRRDGGSLMKMNEESRAKWKVLKLTGETTDYLRAVPEIWETKPVIEKFFRHAPVWNRVWIVQEVAFAPQVLLVAGHSTLPWEEVERFLDVDEYIRNSGIPDAFHDAWSHQDSMEEFLKDTFWQPQIFAHQRRVVRGLARAGSSRLDLEVELLELPVEEMIALGDRGLAEGYSHLSALGRLRARQVSGQESGRGGSLLDVLARFREQRATDPRDMIYALLGLCTDTLGIRSDYSLSVKDIFIDCSKRIIDRDGNLDLVCQGPWELFETEKRYSTQQRTPDLPSWVPDYSNPGKSNILFAQRSIFCAGPEKLPGPCHISPSGALVLEGFPIGTLSIVRPRSSRWDAEEIAWEWMPDSLLRESVVQGNRSVEALVRGERELTARKGPGSRFEHYWRTLLMDCTRYPQRRLDEDDLPPLRNLFEEWRRLPLDTKTDSRRSIHSEVQSILRHTIPKWCFAMLSEGLYAMVPPSAHEGLHVAALPGAKVPVLLSPRDGSESEFVIVGTCYVHGFMDGEAFRGTDGTSKVATKRYEIV